MFFTSKKENEYLTRRLAEALAENDRLQEKNAQLKKELETATAESQAAMQSFMEEVEKWEKDNKALAEQLEAARAQILEHFNARSELEAVVDELRQDLKEAREREDNQRDRHREAIKERDDLQAKVADLEIRLQSACEAMTTNEERAMELQAENLKLTADNNHKQTIIKAYESTTASTRNQYEDQIKSLDATLGKVQDERDRAEENVRVLEVRLKEVAAERDKAEKAVEDMKARFADRREKHTLEVNALVAERNQAKEAMEGAMSDVATWKRRYGDADNLATGWHQEACDLRGELTGVKKELAFVRAERDILRDDLESVFARCKSASLPVPEEVNRLMEALKIKYGFECLDTETEDTGAKVEDFGTARARWYASLTPKEKQALKEINELKAQLAEAEEGWKTARAKCEALAEKLMAVEAERDLLKGDLEAVMAERKSGNIRSEADPEPEVDAFDDWHLLILKLTYGLKL